jgi:hypothetical protein
MTHPISDYTVRLVFINSTTDRMDRVSMSDLYTNSDFRYKIKVNISFAARAIQCLQLMLYIEMPHVLRLTENSTPIHPLQ